LFYKAINLYFLNKHHHPNETIFFDMKLPMFYHKREGKLSIIIKYFLFWSGILFMLLTFFILIDKNNIQIPQQEITLNIDISDKMNICLPDESIK